MPSQVAELYELKIPGKITGKIVIDSSARMVGIVRCVKLNLPDLSVELIIKGKDVEYTIKGEDINNVGDTILLNVGLEEFDALEIEEIQRLREQLADEIKANMSIS
ncbi:MAG: hypothetical protein QXL15_04230 [Candidatus Korarchaeota archaeon]